MSSSNKGKPPQKKGQQITSLGTAISLLDSEKTDLVLDALMTIRKKFIKEKDGVPRIRQHGGLSKLIYLVETTNQKVLDVTLSILGNCCMEEKTRKDVLRKEGIEKLGKVIENVKVSSIQNRAVRTIANLALDEQCRKEIHEAEGLVENIVKLLKDADDPECQQTYLRALRLLCGNTQQIKALLSYEALRLVGETLKSELQPVYTAALKTVAEFTKTEYTNEMARQLLLSDVPATLLKLTVEDDRTVKETAQSYVLAFCKHPELRAGLGSAGAITMFIEKIQDEGIKTQNKYSLVNALCLCSHEAVNRVRIREAKGLELLLKLLDDKECALIHNRLISCLVCFLYDEASFEVLLSNRLVPILLHHLVRVAQLNQVKKDTESTQKEDVEIAVETSELMEKLLDSGAGEVANEKEKEVISELGSKPEQTTAEYLTEASISQPTATKEQSGENSDFKRSMSCPTLPTENTTADIKTVKYSVDSPTYQAISDFDIENDVDYFSGPKNIIEAQQYFGDTGVGGMSPPGGSMSPWSYSTAGASPYRSPGGSMSPPRSPRSSLSPCRSPAQSGPYSPLSVCSIASSNSPDASPEGVLSPQYSVTSQGTFSSPEASTSSQKSQTSFSPLGADAQAVPSSQGTPWTPLASPFHLDSPVLLGSPMWSSATTETSVTTTTEDSTDVHYSSSEEGGNLEENVSLSETCVTSLGDSCASVLSTDPLFLEVASTSTADATFKVPGRSSLRNTPSRSQSPSDASNRKKRRLSEETKDRIKKSVERCSASAPSSPRVIDSIMKLSPGYSKDEYDLNPELPQTNDPVRVTENNLLVLLSRVSYTTNPSEHLISQSCLCVLLDYVLQATNPFPRCGRILSRLTKNPHCFESFILCLGPSLIQAKLSPYNIRQVLQSEAENQNKKCDPSLSIKHSDSASSPPAKKLRLDVSSPSRTAFRSVKERLDKARELGESLLTNLSLVGESRFGRGLVSHLLLTGDEQTKTRCAVALAYVVRSRSLQKQMMISQKGLDNLKSALQTASADCNPDSEGFISLQVAIVQSLLFLAEELKVHWSKSAANLSASSDVMIRPSDHDVTFVMDDGCHVTGSRTLLSATSSVFAAMLEGAYKESDQTEIVIQHASTAAFQLLIKHLHGCDIQTALDAIDIHDTLDVLLQALALSDRYMLETLETEISRFICTKYMCKETVCRIFEVACVHTCADLVKICVQFALSGELSYKDSSDLLKDIFTGTHSSAAFAALQKLIRDKLSSI